MKILQLLEKLKASLNSKKYYMDKQIYSFDLNAIMDFVLKNDESRTSNSEITEVYMQDDETNELSLTSKQLREIKNNGDTSSYTIKYDLLKTFITILDEVDDISMLNSNFLQKMVFNSLLAQGIIKLIDTE